LLVKRVLGLKSLPSVPTVSRILSEFDEKSVAAQQALRRGLVLGRLEKEAFNTITLDFDGSVQSTKRHAEGAAVGFNKEKKVAQLLSAVLHRRADRSGARRLAS
jgi:hypothetical protein